ncbi:MAG: aldehyde dehydrogenase family protein [Acidobacteria bacterium]|nr:MAG: aldehyde dehydrogenase family protein [Acidobacteriota bacterium]REK03090.1 MAG: aldehyde dehydrogenase family protein [Acidobacteriota bacterium]REK15438.1 MAG: aldehyde dehydrogenase family protein [Acidobacteriota bacterium]REK45789.1 MAG: aldehyde dehydrogenase family protein [Acidobacteriota bacterium]
MDNRKLLVGGEWKEAEESFDVRSPYSGEIVASVQSAGPDTFEDAIAVAVQGAGKMRELPRFRIASGLRNISEGIASRADEITRTIALESGKPLSYARGEVQRGQATFAWAASEAERFGGEMVPLDTQANGKGKTGFSFRIPRGIVYGITPFNFPLNLVAHKVAPALASGNAVIIKPSRKTPITSLILGEIFLESGLPKEAFQVVPMDTKYIDRMHDDERVKLISFTGSDKVGWGLKAKSGKKAVSLELGGNAPVIVDETAKIDETVKRVTTGAFAFSGQVCISIQRVLLHEKIADEFTEKFVERANALKVGDPLEESTQLSVMIDEGAAKKAKSWVDEAVDGGAEALCGNERDGAMLSATILKNAHSEMKVVTDEIFAPVAVVETFSDFEEAVSLANESRYGLQAGVFTGDLGRAMFAAKNLEYGGVIVNDVPTFRVDNMPYGGVKDSGFGREGLRYAMEEMSEIRLVSFQ